MLNSTFQGIFTTGETSTIEISQFLLCLVTAFVIGMVLAAVYMIRSRATKSFLITLAMLPAIVCVIIMMVNGNVGAGVAVAGTFSLVRFRSLPGTAREIGMLFLAMGDGLIAGMGYLGFAVLFTLLMCLAYLALNSLDFGAEKRAARYKTIRVTIPEDLDYTSVFDDLFAHYTEKCELAQVKSTNMGSMFRLTYDMILKNPAEEKQLIDDLRCRNGNLEITVSRQDTAAAEL